MRIFPYLQEYIYNISQKKAFVPEERFTMKRKKLLDFSGFDLTGSVSQSLA